MPSDDFVPPPEPTRQPRDSRWGGRGGGLGWSQSMRDEMARIPETAANIREASEKLNRVSTQLVEVSAMLARILAIMESTGITEGLARVEKVSGELEGLRRSLTPPTSLDEAKDRLSHVEDLVFGLSKGVLRTVGFGAPPRPATTSDVAADPAETAETAETAPTPDPEPPPAGTP